MGKGGVENGPSERVLKAAKSLVDPLLYNPNNPDDVARYRHDLASKIEAAELIVDQEDRREQNGVQLETDSNNFERKKRERLIDEGRRAYADAGVDSIDDERALRAAELAEIDADRSGWR